MNQLFYSQFNLDHLRGALLCGDDSREMLTRTLAKEIVAQNENVVIVSNAPLKYPMEGEILVDIEGELLKQTLKEKNASTFYVCKAVENERLLPPNPQLLQALLNLSPSSFRLLLQLENSIAPSWLEALPETGFCMVTSFNFQNLEQHLAQFLNELDSHKTFSDDLLDHWQATLRNVCPEFLTLQKRFALQKFLFVNQVKSLINENKMMGIFRNLTGLYDKIFYGDINDFKLKEI